eukprot:TRINITY_DN8971_c0_g1_i2.p1 TRINITY_DN8971_c0_g1~~TRINITY_DN8971_c0_g1_i2.p1  ORF type:complete len:534 (+),score=112.15 TRINITY_DN8971_c0_g1_i2:35-1636(+)
MKASTLRMVLIWIGVSSVVGWMSLGGWVMGGPVKSDAATQEPVKIVKKPEKLEKPAMIEVKRPSTRPQLPLVPNLKCSQGISSMTNADYCNKLNETIWQELIDAARGVPGRLLASPELKKLLKQQHELHRLVAAGQEPAGQRYLVWSLSGGVGNRMQAMVSTFLAAMLSKRVLLLKDWFATTSKKGTPAPKETSATHDWLLEPMLAFTSSHRNDELLCSPFPILHLSDFSKRYPRYFGPAFKDEHVKVDIISKHDKHFRSWKKISCGTPDFPVETVKFTYLWTNQYYLPMFFANPSTAGTMRKLFPDGDAFGPLSRFLIRPNKAVEEVVEAFWCKHDKEGMGSGDEVLAEQSFSKKRVYGLQIRAFRLNGMVSMAEEFERCMKEKLTNSSYALFIASLHKPIRQHYAKNYGGRMISLDAEARGEQQTGSLEMDREALADMLILGRTADYLVSPGSTFGSFVTGYYGRKAIQVHTMGMNACTRMASSQPCFMSLLKHDKILQRMQKGDFGCSPEPIPEAITANCAPHLSIPFKK